jgi:hypothetical protein
MVSNLVSPFQYLMLPTDEASSGAICWADMLSSTICSIFVQPPANRCKFNSSWTFSCVFLPTCEDAYSTAVACTACTAQPPNNLMSAVDPAGVILESEDLHRRAYNATFQHFNVQCGKHGLQTPKLGTPSLRLPTVSPAHPVKLVSQPALAWQQQPGGWLVH